jgi:hypothetical protein
MGLSFLILLKPRYDFNMTFLQIRYALRDLIGLFPEGADGSGIDRLPGCLRTRDGGDAFSTVGSLSLRSREPTLHSTDDHHQLRVATKRCTLA